jgi:hypothetical protein
MGRTRGVANSRAACGAVDTVGLATGSLMTGAAWLGTTTLVHARKAANQTAVNRVRMCGIIL